MSKTPIEAKMALSNFKKQALEDINVTLYKPTIKEVYCVYEEWHGLIGIYHNQEDAIKAVKNIAYNQYDLDPNTELDYEGPDRWGWDGIANWTKEFLL